jgi:phosphate:Na+ symporter
MTLEQAVGVMMGQEIGTTLTAQIAAFRIGTLSFLFILLGFILQELVPADRWRTYGEIVLGFGVLFLGMNLMSEALRVLAQAPGVSTWLAAMGRNRFAGVVAGMIATAIVQSSSAVTGLVVAMGISDTITLSAAISILLGANIGTCVTGLIASFRLSRASRRASIAQILINVIGVAFFVPFLVPFTALVRWTSPSLPRQIANAHTIFNVIVSVVLLPFVRPIAKLATWLVPGGKQAPESNLTAYIDDRQLRIPQVALKEALRELHRLGEVTAQMVEQSRRALLDQDLEAAGWVLRQEDAFVDPVCTVLERFVNTLLRSNLSASQQRRCFQIKNLIADVERVGDLTENLAQAAQQRIEDEVRFSPEAMADLDQLCRHAHHTYTRALEALLAGDQEMGRAVCRMEAEFDGLYLEARQKHVRRQEAGICRPEADLIFVESLRNLERISDHADNLGVSVSRN